jgi:Mg2+ and Co2+ transporter CorA
MNLQENIRRILREEEQRKTKTDEFQKLIDDEVESMKEICEQMGADDEEIISFDACDFLDLDPKYY